MDSISQAVLGAAVGEAFLGRKLGNKAMFWGALGGTIPDLDVITAPLLTELQSLSFHRGISHSITFALLGGLLFGWLIHKLYKSNYYRNTLWLFLSLFITSIPLSIVYFLLGHDDHKYLYAAIAIVLSSILYFFFYKKNASKPKPVIDNPSLRSWQWMFILAFFTHALLDCFTIYGTQLFLPFSDYRVAFATIAVADPIAYTIPFLICLIIAMCYARTDKKRLRWTSIGIGISSLYLIFTIFHKQIIFKEFDRQLAEQNIEYDRYSLGPVIFSNLLWTITVESDQQYYNGTYSVFDSSPIQFLSIPKNEQLLPAESHDETIKTLRWFSDDFYNVMERPDGMLQFNDLRFGTFRQEGHINDFIFRFLIEKQKDGKFLMTKTIGGPDEDSLSSVFGDLFKRIAGR